MDGYVLHNLPTVPWPRIQFVLIFQDGIVYKHHVTSTHVRMEVYVAWHLTDICVRVLKDLVDLIAVVGFCHVRLNPASMGFVLKTKRKKMVIDANVTFGG